jgi:uncharacterized protein (TIGR00645 family)
MYLRVASGPPGHGLSLCGIGTGIWNDMPASPEGSGCRIFINRPRTRKVMDPNNKPDRIKTPEEQSVVERVFEKTLWNSRIAVILAVIFGSLSSIVLFLAGSLEVIQTFISAVSPEHLEVSHSGLLVGIIGAVDLFLIATVLLIFSFGIYELFISKIDIARDSEAFHTLLEISTLDDLKNKIIKVIIMVLIVSFFQRVLELQIANSTDMLMMAISIAAICIGVYFLQRLKV